MLVYLVEDDPLKSVKISQFLLSAPFGIEMGLGIEVFGSFQSGLKAIIRNMPDLILLDMTLPTFDRNSDAGEGRLRPLGGYELMRKLKLRKLDFSAVVVTQLETFGEGVDRTNYKEITQQCHDEFLSNFLGSVHFGPSSDSWKFELEKIITVNKG
jgi:DNA-binding NarL/FixJ family response regulator